MNDSRDIYGVLAEFDTADGLIDAARAARAAGYRNVETMTPFPIEDLAEALELPRSPVPACMAAGGLLGGGGAYLLLWWTSVIDYPWNIGGRPLHSWPSFIPITFELTVLGGVLIGLVAFFVLGRLTTLHHPVFNVRRIRRASRDRFFLIIRPPESDAPDSDAREFDAKRAAQWLRDRNPAHVEVVPQ